MRAWLHGRLVRELVRQRWARSGLVWKRASSRVSRRSFTQANAMASHQRSRKTISVAGVDRVAELFEAALAVQKNSYSPYSGYRVGAAVLTTSGAIFAGCNVENAAFPQGACAEAGAISAMCAAGSARSPPCSRSATATSWARAAAAAASGFANSPSPTPRSSQPTATAFGRRSPSTNCCRTPSDHNSSAERLRMWAAFVRALRSE